MSALEQRSDVLSVSADVGRLTISAGDSDAVARTLLTELGAHDLEIAAGSMDDAFRMITEGAER